MVCFVVLFPSFFSPFILILHFFHYQDCVVEGFWPFSFLGDFVCLFIYLFIFFLVVLFFTFWSGVMVTSLFCFIPFFE